MAVTATSEQRTANRFDASDDAGKPYSFSGHETFPFRYPWPAKGVRWVMHHDDLFTRPDAGILLGVGKNMVFSIRHWCYTLGLIEPTEPGHMRATELGHLLFADAEGLDPYLQDSGTIWFLHWLLVSNRARASTWHFAFTRWARNDFTRDDLVLWLMKIVADFPAIRTTENTVQRDVEVFVRTYLATRGAQDLPNEETFDCPLIELGLLEDAGRSEDSHRTVYRFVRGPKPTLPPEIFLAALCDYWQREAPERDTLAFEAILNRDGSPGAAFKLSENALASLLEALPSWTGLRFDETAGIRQVLRAGSRPLDRLDVLRRYYGGATVGDGRG